MTELELLLVQEWNKIELRILEKQFLVDCIKMNGYPTKY